AGFLFPLPLGEGQCEGAKRSEKRKKVECCSLCSLISHPNPKGEGVLEDGDLALMTTQSFGDLLLQMNTLSRSESFTCRTAAASKTFANARRTTKTSLL